jgi:diadenosine tetraphosphate (Ap4A) HIT family hydrolase
MNATLAKFGYPQNLLHETRHWCVLLRPQQCTLAALVLAAKSEAEALGKLGGDAFAELGDLTQTIETALQRFRPFDKINYLALMMVDPHVHFHVLPRYGGTQTFAGTAFADAGWPGVPDLKAMTDLSAEVRRALHEELKATFHWASTPAPGAKEC